MIQWLVEEDEKIIGSVPFNKELSSSPFYVS